VTFSDAVSRPLLTDSSPLLAGTELNQSAWSVDLGGNDSRVRDRYAFRPLSLASSHSL
jgi:hypothetical protein